MPCTAWPSWHVEQQKLPQVQDDRSFTSGQASGSGQCFDAWPGAQHGAEGRPQQSQGMQVPDESLDATGLQNARRLAALPKPAAGDVAQPAASTAMSEVQSKVWAHMEMLAGGVTTVMEGVAHNRNQLAEIKATLDGHVNQMKAELAEVKILLQDAARDPWKALADITLASAPYRRI